jgi:hypothetical protein
MELILYVLGGFVILLLIAGFVLYVRYLRNKKKIRIILTYPDRRMRMFKVTPKTEIITIDGKSFTIKKEDLTLYRGMPTFIFNYENTSAISPFTGKITGYNPNEFNDGIETHLINELFATMKNPFSFDLGTILMIAVIAAVGISFFMISKRFDEMSEQIVSLTELIETLTRGY